MITKKELVEFGISKKTIIWIKIET